MAASAFSGNSTFHLADIAELSLGYSFRGRIETMPDAPLRLIQMRDLSEGQLVDVEHSLRGPDPGVTQSHMLKAGDVVFRARGSNNTAAFAPVVHESSALVSPLIRIRAKDDSVEPRYIQWFINLPQSQAYLSAGSQGSLVRMVSIEHLAKLNIVVPSLDAQRRIVELADLAAREAVILRRLAELKVLYFNRIVSENLLGTDRSENDS
jgi:hypothetical protein